MQQQGKTGWMSANDIRELENMDLIPDELGGNLYLINGAMTKLQDAGVFAQELPKEKDKKEVDKNGENDERDNDKTEDDAPPVVELDE